MTVRRRASTAFDPFARPDGSCLGRRSEEEEPPESGATVSPDTPPADPAEPRHSPCRETA